ncbi:MAG: methylmalonyl Co-A mutase-associated GTPase MeaB, partial [Acidobacteriota bacterium]
MTESGEFKRRRTRQLIEWMWSAVDSQLIDSFRRRPDVLALATELEGELATGATTPALAIRRLLERSG